MEVNSVLGQIKNLHFSNNGCVKAIRKNKVIKNVAYITQLIGNDLVTIKLDPPRNLKITNKKRITKQKGSK